jgi:hypothetical protein
MTPPKSIATQQKGQVQQAADVSSTMRRIRKACSGSQDFAMAEPQGGSSDGVEASARPTSGQHTVLAETSSLSQVFFFFLTGSRCGAHHF